MVVGISFSVESAVNSESRSAISSFLVSELSYFYKNFTLCSGESFEFNFPRSEKAKLLKDPINRQIEELKFRQFVNSQLEQVKVLYKLFLVYYRWK